MGYDARVGFGFEKSRSRSRCFNKCIYIWEGCKKSFCRKTIEVKSFFESFQVVENENDLNEDNVSDNNLYFEEGNHLVNENKNKKNFVENNDFSYFPKTKTCFKSRPNFDSNSFNNS